MLRAAMKAPRQGAQWTGITTRVRGVTAARAAAGRTDAGVHAESQRVAFDAAKQVVFFGREHGRLHYFLAL